MGNFILQYIKLALNNNIQVLVIKEKQNEINKQLNFSIYIYI